MPVAAASYPVIVIAEADSGLRAALAQAGCEVTFRPLHETASLNGTPAQVLVIDGDRHMDAALQLCQRIRQRHDDSFVPILFLSSATSGGPHQAGLDSGADVVLPRTCAPAEMIAQIQALGRIKERHDLLAARAAEAQRINKRLQAAYQQIDQELELARHIQQSFLPQSLPELPQLRCAVQYRPCGRVGGDFYDVFRLDEHHLGLYVADAMGHGVPASLLTVFVKTSVKAKEITGQSYRLVPPDEVLQRLNRDMIEQALSETPFITMAYVLFNWRTGVLQFARAGHPYPLYVPREGPPTLWQVEGSLLGVFDTRYRVQEHQLHPGDKVLLYTDGMDGAAFGTHAVGQPSLLAAAEEYRRLPINEMVDRLATDLFNQARQGDDLTVLGLELQI